MKDEDLKQVIRALFEARFLKRIKRSGTTLLLGDEVSESVVEHSFYVSLWAVVFIYLEKDLDKGKLLQMCVLHDLEEVRIGDFNKVNDIYIEQKEQNKAFEDMWDGSEIGRELIKIHLERHEGKTREAVVAGECDVLAELVTEKEYAERGVKEAEEWMEFTMQRLKTDTGRKLAKLVLDSRMSGWWEEIKNRIRKKYGVVEKKYN